MAVTKVQKAEILKDLVDKFSKSKAVVFAEYKGLTVSNISELRKRLREKGSECKVAKKTLMRLAAKETNFGDLSDDMMEGPVAATFSYEDELSGLQILFKYSKENDKLRLLGGIVDGKTMNAAEIIQLAKLPSKNELLCKLLGSMNAPVSGFVGILGNLLGGFVRVVNAYKDTLPAELPKKEVVAVAPQVSEAPKEEIKAEETPVTPAEEPKKEV